MDFYTVAGIILILAVAVAVIAAARNYQHVRKDTGYHQGRYYRLRQHMGAFIGNREMNKLGMEEADGVVETNEEMFYYNESDKQ
jgi:hypothetical protein